jgi:AAA domain
MNDAEMAVEVAKSIAKQERYMKRCTGRNGKCGKYNQPIRPCCHRYLCASCHDRECKPVKVLIIRPVIAEYPFLEAYKRGDLLDMWQSQTKEIIDADDGKLSPNRAGEIAAAIISVHVMLEYELLEEQIRAQDFTDERRVIIMAKFQKAVKSESFLKMGIAAPPGGGKTYTALNIAKYLSKKGIALIDAEGNSATKYADLFAFDTNDLSLDDNGRELAKPFSPQRYVQAIKDAYNSGLYDVLIVDGATPEWNDAGGCLQWIDQISKNGDTRAAWKIVTPAHQDFYNTIIRTRMHIIVTMHAKKETVVVKNDNGQVTGKKVTLDPIQRDDMPRIFDIFATMQDRDLIIDKTRCPELEGQVFHKPGKEVADILIEWLKGAPMPEQPEFSITHDEASAPLDTIPTISQLQQDCAELYGADKWKAVVSRVLKRVYDDEELTPNECKNIQKALHGAREKRESQQAS